MSDPERQTAAEEDLTSYRPVSAWAVAAFLIGLISPVALVHPLGLLVPMAGVVMAGWAFYSFRRVDPPPTGRRWAVAGLALSLFFLAAAPVRLVARRHALHARACAFCDEWLAAIRQNRPWLAFELMRPAHARPALDTPLEELSKSEGFKMGYQKFLENPAVKLLLADQTGGRIRFVRELRFESNEYGDYFDELYEAVPPADRTSGGFMIRLSSERTLSDTDRREQWKMANVGRWQE